MKTLGVDPAVSSPTGIALVENGVCLDWLELRSNPKDDHERRIADMATAVGVQIEGSGASVVAIESQYIPTQERGKVLAAKAKDALELAELVRQISMEAARLGVEVVMVTPAEGFKALTGSGKGDKATHVRFANSRRGRLPKLEDGEDHMADAFGVALHGESVVRHAAKTGVTA